MKYSISLFLLCQIVVACTSTPKLSNTVFEIIFQDAYSGGNFEFYELITEENEFQMLLKDKRFKKKLHPDDIKKSNFVLLNMGEKNTGGYEISVKNVKLTKEKVMVYIHKIQPKAGENVTMAMTYPLCLVKINSKKPIEFIED
jgi:hypothetical protein